MSQTALELLVRVAGEQLVSEPCATCGASLEAAAVRVRDRAVDRVVLELTCGACARVARIEIRPEAGEDSTSAG